MLGFSNQQVREFLGWYSYIGNPDALVDSSRYCPVEVSETEAYLDISPDAVRKGDLKPERPVRLTFRKVTKGGEPAWELKSVAELPPGVAGKRGSKRLQNFFAILGR
jgi:hypothetical protein